MEDVVGAMKLVGRTEGRITWASEPLPFPDSYETRCSSACWGLVQTTLTDEVRETVEHFRREVDRLDARRLRDDGGCEG